MRVVSNRIFSHLAYLLVGLASLMFAVFISSKVVKSSYSQNARDEDAEIFKDMLQETPKTVQPAAPSAKAEDVVPTASAMAPTSPQPPEPVSPPPHSTSPQGPTSTLEPVSPGSPISAKPSPPAPTQNPTSASLPDNVSFLEPYVYDLREGRRNPFRPPQLSDGVLADTILPGAPLERYELDELKLAGIMWDVKSPKAMIVDPHGEVHILGKDDRIGRKHGYIAVIREGEVVVVETTTFNGENAYSTRVLRISK